MQTLLLSYFLAFFAIVIVWPTWRLWRRERINALVLPRDDSAHGVIGRWFKGLMAGMYVLVLALGFGLDVELLGRLRWAEHEAARLAGWALLGVGLVVIVLAQAQMGRSWRMGIDAQRPTALVMEGIFARSRNPIFLGMRLNVAGLFLLVPCGVTLAILLLGEALIAVQVRLEEAHLASTLGADYRAYLTRVPRWV